MNSSYQPTICIIGGGLAGLITSLNVKELMPHAQVMILEKDKPQSNTQISGMRFRLKKSGTPAATVEEWSEDLLGLLTLQNEGTATPLMAEFASTSVSELQKWEAVLKKIDVDLTHRDNQWFGPQWGKVNQSGEGGRASSVFKVLRQLAKDQDVFFMSGEAMCLNTQSGHVTGVVVKDKKGVQLVSADEVVLANGNAGGTLYESTNKAITNSASELLFNAGFPLEGGTLNMWHPFGRSSALGEARNGCYETDNLAGAQVFLADGTLDKETTALLAEHRAHYFFGEICQRFIEHGSKVQLILPSGESINSRVSLHYSHLSGVTTDGSSVGGADNLHVVGDAGGFLHWSNHRPRLPGFALSHCLVSAKVCADRLQEKIEGQSSSQEHRARLIGEVSTPFEQSVFSGKNDLQKINTEAVAFLEFSTLDPEVVLKTWQSEIKEKVGESPLAQLSLGLVKAWNDRVKGKEEPLLIETQRDLGCREEKNEVFRRGWRA